MTTPLSPEDIDRIARKRAGAKLGWFIHATVFVLVNLFVFGMSQYAFGTRPWSVKPFLGWGLGLALHGISVWFLGSTGGIRERMVQRERAAMLREQEQHKNR